MPSPRLTQLLFVLAAAAIAAACGAPDEKSNVAYDSRYGATNMNIYLPSGGTAHRPAVMLVHGGAWSLGSKVDMQLQAQRLARSGYVSASIDYRLGSDGAFPKDFQDCECALAFLRLKADEYGLDPNRIAVLGYSAGGQLVSLLGVASHTPELATDCVAAMFVPVAPPAAVISGAGPSDMRALASSSAVTDYLGGTPDQVPHAYDEASPIFHVRAGEPPFLIIQGDADWFVNIDAQARMRDALAAAGNDVHMLKLAGGGHILNPQVDPGEIELAMATDEPEAWIAIEDFLARTIGTP
jgi:acetyl esterase/lipase